METNSQTTKLKVDITPFSAWMIGVGSIIGSMAWLIHSSMLARAGVVATVAAWLVAALVTLPLALILMELSSMFPAAGGPYVYKYYALKRLFPHKGEMLGFLCGWLFWISNTVGLACIANGVSNLTSELFYGSVKSSPLWYGPIIILVFFGLITVFNLMSVAKVSKLNSILTVIKLLVAIIFVVMIFLIAQNPVANIVHNSQLETLTPEMFLRQLSSVSMLALAGYSFIEMTGCISYETKDATHAVPRALILTLITVTIIYLAISVAIGAASPLSISQDGSTMLVSGTNIEANCPGITQFIAGKLMGQFFVWFVVMSIFACGFAAVMGLARVSYSMALTNLFPKQFALLDAKSGVPKFALKFQFICLLVIGIGANVLTRTGIIIDAYIFLVETFGFMYAFVAMIYGVCVISLRYTDSNMPRPFRVGKNGNALVIFLALIVISVWGYSAIFCVNWKHQLTGVLVLMAGVPVFKYYRPDSKSKNEVESP